MCFCFVFQYFSGAILAFAIRRFPRFPAESLKPYPPQSWRTLVAFALITNSGNPRCLSLQPGPLMTVLVWLNQTLRFFRRFEDQHLEHPGSSDARRVEVAAPGPEARPKTRACFPPHPGDSENTTHTLTPFQIARATFFVRCSGPHSRPPTQGPVGRLLHPAPGAS